MYENKFLIVSTDAIPEVFSRVIEAKDLIKQGKANSVTEATKVVGISRSTYYKYCDHVFTLKEGVKDQKISIGFTLSHESGVLSHLLELIAEANGNVLTLSQDSPINGVANVTITFDIKNIKEPVDQLIAKFKSLDGVVKAVLLSME